MWFDILKSLTVEEADATRAYWPDEDIGKGTALKDKVWKKMSTKIISDYLSEKGIGHIFNIQNIYDWADNKNRASKKEEGDRGIYDFVQILSSGLGDKDEHGDPRWNNRGMPPLQAIGTALNSQFISGRNKGHHKQSKINYTVVVEERKSGAGNTYSPTKYRLVS